MDVSSLRILGYSILLFSDDKNIITAATMLVIAELINLGKKL